MLKSSLPRRNQRAPLQSSSHRLFSRSTRRAVTATSPPPPPQSDRIQRILRRTPKFLRPTISGLHNAPLTHISAFLILHELTAIIPIFGLVGAFHYFQWLPPFFAEGKWVVIGVEKFGNYFRRKGWIDAGNKREAEKLAEDGQARDVEKKGKGNGRIAKWLGRGEVDKKEKGNPRITKWWGRGEMGTRLVVEFATAYAVVKVLLPLRLFLSVWGAPWFARWTVVPLSNMVKGLFKSRSKQAGAGAVNVGVKSGGTKAANGENITK